MPSVREIQKNMPAKDLTPKQAAHLAELTKVARQARGAYYSEEVARASTELSALLAQYLNEGVRYRTLSDATGIQWRSIKARIARHGYLNCPPSQEAKKFQGPSQPGPHCDHDKSRYRERKNKNDRVTHIECLDCRSEKRRERLKSQTDMALAG